jgi:hypothetical protein
LDGSRFDGWTRRRFGLVTGGATATGLLSLLGFEEADARRRRRRRKRRKKKQQQCQRLGQSCNQTLRRQQCCNQNQLCAQVSGLGSGNFCCKQNGRGCTVDTECCGNDRCLGPSGARTCRLPT